MNKQTVSTALMAGLAATGAVTGCSSSKKTARPKQMNIVYIMCDDHSYQTISAYDSRYIQTPNIDRIANEGARFTNSFVANSLSGPSRACIITGKHSWANGFLDNSTTFDGDQQTYPKLLQESGYQTACIGKWHLVSQPQGFDYWNILIGQGEYYNPNLICMGDTTRHHGYATNIITDLALDWLDGRDKDKPFCLLIQNKAPHRSWEPDSRDYEEFSDVDFPLPENYFDDYAGRSAAQLQEMSVTRDMSLYRDLKVWYENDPDALSAMTYPGMKQREMPRYSVTRRYDEEQLAAFTAHYDKVNADFAAKKPQGEELIQWKFNQYMRDYLRCIRSVDRNVGRVLDYLEANGLMDNTIIVYTSDQGFYMGEHGWFDKRFMYEESFRTPLLVRMPGGVHGDIGELVQNIDYAPTFLELAGVEVPEDMHGVSLLPLLKGEKPKDWRTGLYYHYYEFPSEHAVRKHFGLRTNRYKLIRYYWDENDQKILDQHRAWGMKDYDMANTHVDEWELYDLKNDAGEMHNIYGQEGTEQLTEELKAQLKELQASYGESRFWTD